MKISNPVFVLMHGPSLVEVEKRIGKLKQLNPIWATVNDFHVLEKKLGIELDMVYVSARCRFEERVQNLIRYVKNGGFYITNVDIRLNYTRMFEQMDRKDSKGKYTVTSLAHEPGISHNSMTVLLLWLSEIRRPSEIYLFGCDGGRPPGCSTLHYGEDVFPLENNEEWISKDTETLNERFWGLYEKHKIEFKPRIVNVTDFSYVNCFEKMSWKDFDAYLNETSKTSS